MGVAVDNGSGIQQAALLQFGMMTVAPSDTGAARITPALTSTSAALGAPVTLSSASYFDGPSVTLAAGTWLLMADCMVSAAATNHTLTAKVWDGTNAAVSSGTVTSQASGTNYQINVPAVVVTPTAATTYKVSVKSSTGTTDTILAAVGEGNTATVLTAVRIA